MLTRKPKVWNKRDPNTPKDAVYVGRPSKWGNPFVMSKHEDRDEVVQKYKTYALSRYLDHHDAFAHELHAELQGKDLVCYCAPKPCHADVLLELANQPESNPQSVMKFACGLQLEEDDND